MALRAALVQILRRFFWWDLEAMFMFRKRTPGMVSEAREGETDFQIVAVNRDFDVIQLEQLESFYRITDQPGFNRERLIALLERETCFAAIIGEEVAGVVWLDLNPNHPSAAFSDFTKKLERGAVISKGFVASEYRGKRLQLIIQNAIENSLVGSDITYIYSFVGVKNLASTINSLRFNDEVRLIYWLKIDCLGFSFSVFPKLNVELWESGLT